MQSRSEQSGSALPSSAWAIGARTWCATSTSSARCAATLRRPQGCSRGDLREQIPGRRLLPRLSATCWPIRRFAAVALATPAVTHYEMAKAALEAGKDVFVEKPLAIDVQARRGSWCSSRREGPRF